MCVCVSVQFLSQSNSVKLGTHFLMPEKSTLHNYFCDISVKTDSTPYN